MPPMTTFIEKGAVCAKVLIGANLGDYSEPGDASDDDDDVEVGGVTQDYRCPLTLTPLQDPLTSYARPLPTAFPTLIIVQILGKRANTPSPVLQSANTSLMV